MLLKLVPSVMPLDLRTDNVLDLTLLRGLGVYDINARVAAARAVLVGLSDPTKGICRLFPESSIKNGA